jgi:hypothetical protein
MTPRKLWPLLPVLLVGVLAGWFSDAVTRVTVGTGLTGGGVGQVSIGLDTVPVASGGTGNTSYTGHGVVVANGAGTALQSTNAPNTAGQHLIWDGAQWLPGLQTGTVYYFRRDASDIGGGYEQITQTPQTGAEKTASTTLNNASGTVVFDTYATNSGEPGLSQLLAGTWEFDVYAQVSSTAGGNTTNLVLQVYKRTTGGAETLLFSTTSPALDTTSVKLYSWLYTQPADIALDITDRLVVKVAATNSSASNRTVTFYYEGTSRYSHFHPPFLSLIDAGSLVTIGGTQTITGAKTFSVAPAMSGAGITSNTIPLAALTGGTAGYPLTGNGAGVAPSYQAPVTATTGCASLATAQYDLSGSAYEDVGLSLPLPGAGTYWVAGEVRTFVQTSASPPGYTTLKLYNSTDAADVANSERFGAVDYTNNGASVTVAIGEFVSVAGAKTVKVYAKRNAGPTYTSSGVVSSADGRSRLCYLKVAP